MDEKAKTQAERVSPRSGTAPPKERQFGQPNGNKQGRGFWRREDTARYKLEQMMKLNEDELRKIVDAKDAPLFERRIAKSLLTENEFKTTEAMINQVYGMPKQRQDITSDGEAITGLAIEFKDFSKK